MPFAGNRAGDRVAAVRFDLVGCACDSAGRPAPWIEVQCFAWIAETRKLPRAGPQFNSRKRRLSLSTGAQVELVMENRPVVGVVRTTPSIAAKAPLKRPTIGSADRFHGTQLQKI
jgi:hypothetical protein